MSHRCLALYFLPLVMSVSAQKVNTCGNATYDPSQAVCWNASILCPVVDGLAYQICGDQCYSVMDHACDNEVVCPLPLLEGPYEIRASNQYEPFEHEVINACDGGFFIGRSTCTWCPSQFPDLCSASANITALAGNQTMQVVVPGGQRFYIDPQGALAYTQAHSAHIPENSIVGKIQAFQDGGFVYAAGGGWYACPVAEAGVYRIVNRLEGVVLDAACIGIDIIAAGSLVSLYGSGPFAWQYQ